MTATAKTTDPAPPPRTRARIKRDLAEARAEIDRLRPLAEADGAVHRVAADARDRVKANLDWRVQRGELDRATAAAMLPPEPPMDEELHKRYHRQHYVVAAFEEELARLDASRSLAELAADLAADA